MIDYITFYDKNIRTPKKVKDIVKSLNEDHDFGFELPKLLYSHSDLEPVIDVTTMKLHHGKHHKKYVDKMNELLGETDKSLVELLQDPKDVKDKDAFLDSAGGHFNHSYFWITMSPKMNQKPSGKLANVS